MSLLSGLGGPTHRKCCSPGPLKTLKAALRERDKVARARKASITSATEAARRGRRARADRPRAPHGRAAHQGGALPRGKSLVKVIPSPWSWSSAAASAARTSSRSATAAPARSVSAWRPARRASRSGRLVHELIEARDDKQLQFQKKLATYKLLIVDELGFVPLSKTGAEPRCSLRAGLDPGHHQSALRGEVFGSERLTGALLDRLTHHVNILEMNGESYRLNQSRRRQTPTAN